MHNTRTEHTLCSGNSQEFHLLNVLTNHLFNIEGYRIVNVLAFLIFKY